MRNFNELFQNDFFSSSLFDIVPKMPKNSNGWSITQNYIPYKWDGNKIYIGAPGCTKDDITEASINGKNLILKWNSKFSTDGDLSIVIPDKTQNVDIDVINGLITVTFDTQKSDISISINGGSKDPP